MLDIRTDKVVRVIFLAREYGPDSRHLRDYISGLNEDEAVSLVAALWIGRGSFAPDDAEAAMTAARQEATAPTEAYLAGIPELPDLLEDGMEALGISVADAEDHLRG